MTRPVAAPAQGRILVVDDEEIIASTLQEFLVSEGFEVAVAGDGPTALAALEAFEPDVAICDIQLPGSDGLELLDRTLLVRPELMVLIITAYATVETAVAAFRRGAHDYLIKPIIFEGTAPQARPPAPLPLVDPRKPGAAAPGPRHRRPRGVGGDQPADAASQDLDPQDRADAK